MPTPSSPRHILYLNDSGAVGDLITELLEGEGRRVTAERAWSLDLGVIGNATPDLIVLDVLTGSEAAGWPPGERLKADPRTRKISVVVCTAAFRQLAPIQARQDEIRVRVVPKPFDIDHLLRVIASALDEAAPAA